MTVRSSSLTSRVARLMALGLMSWPRTSTEARTAPRYPCT